MADPTDDQSQVISQLFDFQVLIFLTASYNWWDYFIICMGDSNSVWKSLSSWLNNSPLYYMKNQRTEGIIGHSVFPCCQNFRRNWRLKLTWPALCACNSWDFDADPPIPIPFESLAIVLSATQFDRAAFFTEKKTCKIGLSDRLSELFLR